MSVNGGHDFIIQNNTIKHARTVALDFGSTGGKNLVDSGLLYSGTFTDYSPLYVERYGRNIIRNNTITDAGSNGIMGSTGPHSVTENNKLLRINNLYFPTAGVEAGGIKTHYFIDGIIKDNYIKDVYGANAIWLDNIYQGARVSGNVIVSPANSIVPVIHFEMSAGPLLFDNNIVIGNGTPAIRGNMGEGYLVTHNLFYDAVNYNPANGPRYMGEQLAPNIADFAGSFVNTALSYAGKSTGAGAGFGQVISGLTANTTYTLTAWAKVDTAGESVDIGVKNYNGATITQVPVTSTDYSLATVTFTTGATNTSAEIYLWKVGGTGSAYGDDFKVQKAVPNLVLNPGLETGSLSSWTFGGATGAIVVNNNTHSGTYAGKATGALSGFGQVITGLAANTTYTLTAWAKVGTPGEAVKIGVKNYGGAITEQEITSTSYSQAKVTFHTGLSNTSAEIYLWKYSGAGVAYGDDFKVQRVEAKVGPFADMTKGTNTYTLWPKASSSLRYTRPVENLVDDRKDIVYTGTGWSELGNEEKGRLGGRIHSTATNDDSFEYSFYGTGVQYIAERDVDRGDVDIEIDGVFQQTVSLYNASFQAQYIGYSKRDLAPGWHTIKGTKKSGTYMMIDALNIYNYVNDDAAGISYSGAWFDSNARGLGNYGDDVHYTATNNDYAEYIFWGTGIELIAEMKSDRGNMDIYLDGAWIQTISAYAPTSTVMASEVLFSKYDLDYKQHTIRVVKKSGTYMTLDAFNVNKPTSPLSLRKSLTYGLPVLINDDAVALAYTGSGWVDSNGRSSLENGLWDYKEDVHYTPTNNDYVIASFTGRSVEVIAEKSPDGGDVEVYIDGSLTPAATFSLRSDGTRLVQQRVYHFLFAANASHTIKLVKKSGTYMNIDAIKVYQHVPIGE